MSTSVTPFMRRARRHGLHALALAAALAFAVGPVHAGTTRWLATGDTAPGLPASVTMAALGTPVMDRFGNLAASVVVGGTGVSGANDSALWQSGGPVWREARRPPGLDGGVLVGPMFLEGIAEGGAPIWSSSYNQATGSHVGMWRGDTPLLLTSSAPPGLPTLDLLSFNNVRRPQVSSAGRVAVEAILLGSGVTSANDRALYVDQVLQARTGSAASGTETGTVYASFTGMAAAANGRAVFTAQLSGPGVSGSNGQGVWAGSSLVARTGAQAAGLATGTVYTDLSPTYGFGQENTNAAGQVLFRGRWRNAAGSTGESLWLDQAVVVTVGSAAAGMGPGAVLSSIGYVSLNDAGQVMWAGTARGTASLATPVAGIWRNGTLLVREGAPVPDAGGATLGSLPVIPFAAPPAFNNQGLVSFTGSLEGSGVTSANNTALFITDGIDLVTVVRRGDTRFSPTGSAVTGMAAGSFTDGARQAFLLNFADGTQAIHSFLPDLRWRSAGSGNWDSAGNWTLGLRPDGLYTVTIAPSASITVTGPVGAESVRSLQIGGGSGLAVLNLVGGSITSVSGPVQVLDSGVLTGSGVIRNGLENRGEVRPISLTVEGGLNNLGLVRGSASGPSRLNTSLDNAATGWVHLAPGERLQLDGDAHVNRGTFDLRGGELRIDRGELSNAAGGRVLLNDARLLALGGLRNLGQLQVTFGESEVFGAISNGATGKIILSGNSNTTFYDAVDVARGGELRVSAGSTAVFFGAMHQRNGALFTGTGAKFYEGGLNIGDSPGLGVDAGDVSFGTGNVYVAEIGGLAAGSEHDQYQVAGHLHFGGTLQIVSWAGYTGQVGNSFDLFDWGSRSGSFSLIDSSGLQLAPGAVLDVSSLYVDGRVTVAAVPEPGSWALFGAGALLLAGLRHRRGAQDPNRVRAGTSP